MHTGLVGLSGLTFRDMSDPSARETEEFDVLAAQLVKCFAAGVSKEWSDSDFGALAVRAFRHQFATCVTYRLFCEKRGVTPDTVDGWEDIPAVPATAFKYFDLVSNARGAEPDRVFQTSGTTRGQGTRGRHIVPDAELYRRSLRDPFRAGLLPDRGRSKLPFVSLVPHPNQAPESSLSFMVGDAADVFASEVHWLVDQHGEWSDRARDVVQALIEAGEPVLLLGTALAFAHLVEARPDLHVALPEGSRIMETGGFKGVRRSLPRAELYAAISGATGVPEERIVNEYGMTELLSQMYEPVLTEGPGVQGVHVAPPWLRVRAVDPDTLRPVPDGTDGILAFFDLANLGSVCHVLTEDVGRVEGGRLRLRGRAPGAEPRGCSRAMDDLMAGGTSVGRAGSGSAGVPVP